LGMVLARSGDAWITAQRLAPLVGLFGVPALAGGLLLWRRLTDSALAGLRLAGTALAVGGAMVLMGSIALAWPHPAGMVPVALVNFAILTAVALMLQIPWAHAPALACLG